jgi:hypothetical protein
MIIKILFFNNFDQVHLILFSNYYSHFINILHHFINYYYVLSIVLIDVLIIILSIFSHLNYFCTIITDLPSLIVAYQTIAISYLTYLFRCPYYKLVSFVIVLVHSNPQYFLDRY